MDDKIQTLIREIALAELVRDKAEENYRCAREEYDQAGEHAASLSVQLHEELNNLIDAAKEAA